ncbi:MAG: peroxidase [Betaproteobacteria bacterium]|nr:peroxidase [Betaproteobacteria bacterium]
MSTAQPGILAEPVPAGRYLSFTLTSIGDTELKQTLARLAEAADGDHLVLGIGRSLAQRLNAEVPGLRTMPSYVGRGIDTPSTPAALLLWLRGTDLGEITGRARKLEALLKPAFRVMHRLDGFRHDGGRDLTGYEDGTENPHDNHATGVVCVTGQGAAMEGSTFLAIQQWEHDFECFEAFDADTRDNIIGRRQSDNEELEDAPESAHVKRTAQESFEPEAFMLRRSLPWIEGNRGGLMFSSFCNTLNAFEAQMDRMTGAEDGIADGLFQFSRVLTGAYFWCPGMRGGKLNLDLLGL